MVRKKCLLHQWSSICIFWFLVRKKILGNRLKVFYELAKNIGPKFILITQENVEQFDHAIVKFHPAVKYTLKNKKGLSGNHLSDYLRVYISYYYGGAYHDIKINLFLYGLKDF